jgi:hypothetical protein
MSDESSQLPEYPDDLIVKHSNYSGRGGRQVWSNEIVEGEMPENFLHFTGQGDFELLNPQTGQVIPHLSRFPIPGAETLRQAFDMWDQAAEVHQTNLQGQYTEMVKAQILQMQRAAGMDESAELSELLGADGRPAKHPDGIITPGHSVFDEKHVNRGDEDSLKRDA